MYIDFESILGASLFLNYIHLFRALAIFFIVAGHSIDMFIWNDSPELGRTLRIFISNGSVLFVFIAGYLFQHLSENFDTKKYYKSKLVNVITPYILISIPAIIIFVTIMQRETVWDGFYENSTVVQVILFYLTGKHLAPLWFVPMISIFYLLGPLLVKADRGKWFYYLLPGFILLSCIVGRGYPQESFVHFFSVYLLGMFCSRYKGVLNSIFSNKLFLIFSLLMILVLAYVEYAYAEGTMTFYNYNQKIFMTLFFLGLLIRYGCSVNSKLINAVADTSFGIFFIHSYVLTGSKLIYQKIYGYLPDGGMLFYFLSSIALLVVCTILIKTTKELLGNRSRYLIGS